MALDETAPLRSARPALDRLGWSPARTRIRAGFASTWICDGVLGGVG